MSKEVDQAKALALTAELYADKVAESETRWGWYSEANKEREALREENAKLKSELNELKKEMRDIDVELGYVEDETCKSSE